MICHFSENIYEYAVDWRVQTLVGTFESCVVLAYIKDEEPQDKYCKYKLKASYLFLQISP